MTRDRDDRFDYSRDDRYDRQGQGRGVGRQGDMNDRYGHYDYGNAQLDPASGMRGQGMQGQGYGQSYDRDMRDYSDRSMGGMGRSYSEDQGRYRGGMSGGQDYGRQGMGQGYGPGYGQDDRSSGMGPQGYGQRGMGQGGYSQSQSYGSSGDDSRSGQRGGMSSGRDEYSYGQSSSGMGGQGYSSQSSYGSQGMGQGYGSQMGGQSYGGQGYGGQSYGGQGMGMSGMGRDYGSSTSMDMGSMGMQGGYGQGYGQSQSYGQSGMGSGQQGYRGKGPKGYQRSDDRIKEAVSDALEDADHVDAENIEVQVQNGEVTLTGTVSDRVQKRRAEECVEHLRGVKDVHNQLRVQQGQQAGMSSYGSQMAQGTQSGTGAMGTGSMGMGSQSGSGSSSSHNSNLGQDSMTSAGNETSSDSSSAGTGSGSSSATGSTGASSTGSSTSTSSSTQK